uniref:Uncharacterized protein n=1 Tax=Megaselia scalaris TaxID=36166 RepID=T1GX05_MEGSC
MIVRNNHTEKIPLNYGTYEPTDLRKKLTIFMSNTNPEHLEKSTCFPKSTCDTRHVSKITDIRPIRGADTDKTGDLIKNKRKSLCNGKIFSKNY